MAASRSFTLPKKHAHDVIDLKFNGTGSHLASCGLDGTVAIYDLANQCYTHVFEFDEAPSCMSWAHALPGYSALIVGLTNGSLRQVVFKQGDVSDYHHRPTYNRD